MNEKMERDFHLALRDAITSARSNTIKMSLETQRSPELTALFWGVLAVPQLRTLRASQIIEKYTLKVGGLSALDLVSRGWWFDGIVDFVWSCSDLVELSTIDDVVLRVLSFFGEVDEWGITQTS